MTSIRTPDLAGVDRITLANDVDDRGMFERNVSYLGGRGVVKTGFEAGYAIGWDVCNGIAQEKGSKSFLDLKLKDIPTTMGKAAKAISSTMNPWAFNVHASARPEGMRAAVENAGDCLVFAVTVLTSIKTDEQCIAVYGDTIANTVRRFALWAAEAGCHGLICAPGDLPGFADLAELDKLLRVCPSIRPSWAPANDQGRPTTPAEGLLLGTDYQVIGRPITQPPPEIGSSEQAVESIALELDNAA